MGLELLTLDHRFELAVLAVSGARLVSVLTDGGVIGEFKPAIYALVGGEEIFNGITPLAQVLLDSADPGTFAPFLFSELRHELIGEISDDELTPPHLLMQVAMNDEIVPNSANFALARALNLAHIESRIEPIPLLQGLEAPVRANHNGRTAGVFQFDRVTVGPSRLAPSDHMNVPTGREGRYQARKFLESWLSEDVPVIVNPYSIFRVPPLSEPSPR
jgi:hypothetical protein